MKKRIALIVLCLYFLLSAVGCDAGGDIAETARPSGVSQEMTSSLPETASTPESTDSEPEPEVDAEISYPLEMYFSSGAGAWYTQITLNADGSFTGGYQDSDIGDIGEGYPNGKVYECKFSGKFSELRFVNDYTFALTLETLEMEGETGQTRIEDGTLYEILYPYGLMNTDGSAPAKNFLLYTPDAPIEKLREAFLFWWPERFNGEDLDKLMLYGLCNTETDEGFFTTLEI